MPLERGTRLGPYQIESPIGAGGMGEVYKATDTRLERTVAIKVLPAHVASDPERKARFEREVKVISGLNHPHICTLYEFDNHEGTDFLVMEYLEGETLADRLTKGALPLDQALRYAIEIADALDKAHRQGVTHRDLKPANIMLTKAGTKLLDFGLAKLTPTGPQSDASTKLADALTEQGTILGTFQYMAPEQLEGQDADARTDIWAFGCVVYEMVTGQKAFEGKSQASLIHAIMGADPRPIASLQPMSPPMLDHVIRICLAKDLDERWQSAGDIGRQLKLVIDGIATQVGIVSPAASTVRPEPWGRSVQLVIAVMVGGVISGLAVWSVTSGAPAMTTGNETSEPVRHVDVALPDTAPLVFIGEDHGGIGRTALRLSPDGRYLVYVGPTPTTTQLYVRSMDGYEVRTLPGTEGAYGPFLSPDSQWIGFFVDHQLMRVSIEGGRVFPIAEANTNSGGSWSEDDQIAVVTGDGRRLGIVAPAGGELAFVELAPHPSFYGVSFPFWLPGSEWVLLTCQRPIHLCAVSIQTGEWRHLVTNGVAVAEDAATGSATLLAGSDARYVAPGYLVYSAPEDNVVMGVRFDPSRFRVLGDPVALLAGVRRENFAGALQITLASSGDLVFAKGRNAVLGSFVWADRSGVIEPLPFPTRAYGPFYISSDGNRIAAVVYPPVGGEELWFLDVASGREQRWVDEGLLEDRELWLGSWIPDTTEILVNTRGATNLVVAADAERASGGRRLWSGSGDFDIAQVGSDGRLLVGARRPSETASYLSLIEPSVLPELPEDPSEMLAPLVDSVGHQPTGLADLSPDMEWVAFTSNESGPYEVYAVRLPPDGPPIRVSQGGGELPRWSPQGDGLYYRDGQRWYWVARTNSDDEPFAPPEFFVEGDFLNVGGPEFEVSPDGSRLLLLQGSGERTQSTLSLITNWFTELERLVPTP